MKKAKIQRHREPEARRQMNSSIPLSKHPPQPELGERLLKALQSINTTMQKARSPISSMPLSALINHRTGTNVGTGTTEQ